MSFDPRDLLSRSGSCLTFGSLRSIVNQYSGIQDVIGLHGGLPPPDCYPIASISFQLRDGARVELNPDQALSSQSMISDVRGYSQLVLWLEQNLLNHPFFNLDDTTHRVCITAGSTHTLELLMSMFLDPDDAILMEEYTYGHALETLMLTHPSRTLLPVPMDAQGIIPDQLEKVLTENPLVRKKLLYTIPTGHNPTGCTYTAQRKRDIYELCRKYGLLLIEDDPYCWLHHGDPTSSCCKGVAALDDLAASFLAHDVDGRVVRLDSFSKCLGPGYRVGWVIAPKTLYPYITMAIQGQTLGASAPAQVILYALLNEWGVQGFSRQLKHVQQVYKANGRALLDVVDRHLTGLAEWTAPSAGMFFWLKLQGVKDTEREVLPLLRERKVIMVPGRTCHPRVNDTTFSSPYLRVSFAGATYGQLEEGIRELAKILEKKL